jgi:hypothetical protein
MSETLPNTINPNDEKYDRLGREFADRLGRTDGKSVAKSIHAHFEQDLRDWFYDCVWLYFSGIPQNKWSQNESMAAEFNCRNIVSFFQSIRGTSAATERGYVPATEAHWFTGWLLRLNLGKSAAQQATEGWFQAFRERDRQGQLQLFSAALAKSLPEIPGKPFLLYLYAPTLDLRVQATTARAFGDTSQAQKLHAEAFATDENLGMAIHQYSTGGSVCYVLESDQGLLLTQSQQYGKLFNLWTQAEYAKQMNEGLYGGKHRISPMDYRELDGQLQRMQLAGRRYVSLDRRISGDVRVIPIGDLLQHVQKTINTVESSELGKAMKRGFEE